MGCDGGGLPPAASHPALNDMRTISCSAFWASSYSLRSIKSEYAFSKSTAIVRPPSNAIVQEGNGQGQMCELWLKRKKPPIRDK